MIDNGFVTMNVLEMLLDLNDYSVKFDKNVYEDALMAILDHQDKNSPRYLPKFSFWTQKPIFSPNNETCFIADPTNIVGPLRIYKTLNKLINFSARRLMFPPNVKETISYVNDFSAIGGSIFSIPPDADDTGCALGISAAILRMIQLDENAWLREPASAFFSVLSDPYKEALDSYLKYAYKPYSANVDESVIDPRTYHWIRHFLLERNGNVDLITTWFQKISEISSQEAYQKMPFSVNNIDGSVVVNGLYGILSTIAAQPSKYALKITPDLIKLLKDSLDLVNDILEKDLLASHASSILLYYPSRYAFYYFVSRLVCWMDNTSNVATGLPRQLSEIWEYRVLLRTSMQKYGTPQMLTFKKDDASSGVVYWDDFLGNGDLSPNFEDRVFSSSMAFNALVNTWTEGYRASDGSKRLRYSSDISPLLATTIERAAQFLLSKETDALPQENAFFSASVKDQNSLPFYGVTNYRKSVDGMHSLECTDNLYQGINYVFGVKGLMSEDDYSQQLKAGCFNTSTANPDVDYNR